MLRGHHAELPGRPVLSVVERGQVDRDIPAKKVAIVFVAEIHITFLDDAPFFYDMIEGHDDDLRLRSQYLGPLGDQLRLAAEDMPLIRKGGQRISYPAPRPYVRILAEPQVRSNKIGGLEPDALDLVCKAIRIFLHHGDAPIPELGEDPRRKRRRDLALFEELYDVLDLFLLLPGRYDLVDPALTQPAHGQELMGLFFYDAQGVRAKGAYDLLRALWPDALDQPRTQIPFDPICRGRELFRPGGRDELPAELTIDLPSPLDIQDGSDPCPEQIPYNGDQILMAFCAAL